MTATEMSSGRPLWRRGLEAAAWTVVIPAIVVSLMNAELFRLVIGAFGPPPDAGMIRFLLLGTGLAGLAFWRARRAKASDGAMAIRSAILALAALATVLLVVARSRDVRRRDVTFDGNGIRIGATIYEPLTQGRHAAVVFVPGSAPFKRTNGASAGPAARSSATTIRPKQTWSCSRATPLRHLITPRSYRTWTLLGSVCSGLARRVGWPLWQRWPPIGRDSSSWLPDLLSACEKKVREATCVEMTSGRHD